MNQVNSSSVWGQKNCVFRDSGQIEQEVQTVQEKLFAWLDQGSVCGQECTSRESTLVEDRRMGWHTRERDLLRPRFAKSDSGR